MASTTDGEPKVWIKAHLDAGDWECSPEQVKGMSLVGSRLFPAIPVSETVTRMAAEAERRQVEENCRRQLREMYGAADVGELMVTMFAQALTADFGKLFEQMERVVLAAEATIMYPRMAFLLVVLIAIVAMITG